MVWMQAQRARNRKPSLNGKPSVLNCLKEKGKQREITVFRYCSPYGQTCSCQEPVRCVWRYTDGLPLWQPNLHQPVCLLSHLHWSSLFSFSVTFLFPTFLTATLPFSYNSHCITLFVLLLVAFFVYFFSAYLIISLSFWKLLMYTFFHSRASSPNKQLSFGIRWVPIPLSRRNVQSTSELHWN